MWNVGECGPPRSISDAEAPLTARSVPGVAVRSMRVTTPGVTQTEELEVEVSAQDELHVGAADRGGQVGSVAQPERGLNRHAGNGDRRMVKGQDAAVRRRLGQHLAQPGELRVADPSVSLTRHERVEGDDPVSADRGDRRTFTVGSLHPGLRPVPSPGVDVATAQHRRLKIAGMPR